MNPGGSLEGIFGALQERAKELHCLYRVDEILEQGGPEPDVLRAVLAALPAGWQYPETCIPWLKIGQQVYAPKGFSPTEQVLAEPVRVRGRVVGELRIYYGEERPASDIGPFLKQERQLLRTIADRIGLFLTSAAPPETAGHDRSPKWRVVLEFLEHTDPRLSEWLARKMLNHLRWKGILDESDIGYAPDETELRGESNQPLSLLPDPGVPASAVFDLAQAHCSEEEILRSIQSWVAQDKASFLTHVLERQSSSLGEITEALDRFHGIGVEEGDLPRSLQTMLRVALLRRFFSDEIEFINTAREVATVHDFHALSRRLVTSMDSHGGLGGKSAGLFLAQRIVEHAAEYADVLGEIRVPRTWYVVSDAVYAFIRYNNLEEVYDQKYLDIEEVRQQYPHIVRVFKNSRFPTELRKGLAAALDDLGERPLIVRSSSLLEDRTGAAFSGKYRSLFLANQGSREERLRALQDAVAEVYASIFSPDPIEYRAERNLLDVHEEMGIMIQEVVGRRVGRYFMPAFSGVAFSNNEFRWSPRIRREDGLVRLVPGLGTRAVDRTSDDYPVLLTPGQPGLRVNATVDEVVRYAPQQMDVIDLEANAFISAPVNVVLRACGNDFPMLRNIVSVVEDGRLRRATGLGVDPERDELVVTFHGLAEATPFVVQMATLLKVLRTRLGWPVDIEFASDGEHLYLLQCRSQSYTGEAGPATIPAELAPDRVVFTAHRYVSNGRVPNISHVVYVDPERYAELSDPQDMKDVGRVVSRLNKVLPRRRFILMGPGRWGSRGDIRLGVSVTYSGINNTAMLIEIARKKGQYVPDLSFGTHFFQDLVEADIRYLPLYPDEPGSQFNHAFFREARNLLPELVPEFAELAEVVRVIDVRETTGGDVLRILMNGELDQAVAFLTASEGPEPPGADTGLRRRRRIDGDHAEDHWRWRLAAAEALAASMDPDHFGVKGAWLIGSTQHGLGGAEADIDLLVHVRGTIEQQQRLRDWLDGWSRALAEVNYLRTGHRSQGLLDIRYLTDEDLESRIGLAAKIDAITDAARPLRLGG